MSEITETLQRINDKLEQLNKRLMLSEAETELLKRELRQARETISLQKNTLRDLEEQNKIVKIAEAVALSKTDKRAVKLKINEFIREIDKCIATLSD
jgi:chromosome segregation ATPase